MELVLHDYVSGLNKFSVAMHWRGSFLRRQKERDKGVYPAK